MITRRSSLEISVNQNVKVKLTEYGRYIYYHQYDELNQQEGGIAILPSYPKVDEKGYTKFQLWTLMKLYGEYMCSGNQELPFDNKIIIVNSKGEIKQ